LSRCRTMEGIALARPLTRRDLVFDPAALGYRELFPRLEYTSSIVESCSQLRTGG
jgi:hypothetical protein